MVVTNAPSTDGGPSATTTSKVLLDLTQGVDAASAFGVASDPTPAAGTVTVSAFWEAMDLKAGGAPVKYPD